LTRVTSSFWVGAFVRRCYSEDAVATVARKGAEEAGAIQIIVDRLDGTADLYSPAPQSAFDEARGGERLFQRVLERASRADINSRLEKEMRFDSDLWIVEVEDRAGRSFLDLAGA
jgi:hypothetical protein